MSKFHASLLPNLMAPFLLTEFKKAHVRKEDGSAEKALSQFLLSSNLASQGLDPQNKENMKI